MIFGFVLHIGTYLRVWQNQKLLILYASQDTIGDIFCTQDAINFITPKAFITLLDLSILIHSDHPRRNRLWAYHAYLDNIITVGNRQ